MMGVGDGEGHLGLLAAGPGVVLADGDQLAVGVDDQRHMVADILLGRPSQLGLRDDRPRTEESEVARRLAELPVEALQRGVVVGPRRAHPDGPAGRQQHVAGERREQLLRRVSSCSRSVPPASPHVHLQVHQLGPADGLVGSRACEDGTMPERITVFLLDDHEIVRRGLRDLLEAEDDIVVVGEASTEDEAVRRVPALDPDVAVLDVRLQEGDGVSACREIRSRHPRTACLILTSFSDDEALFEAIMAGASGYVLKQIRTTDLVDAVRRVAAGQNLLDPAVTARVLERLRRGPEEDERIARLSPQEHQVLALLAEGLTNRQIAERLYLAEKTIKNYVTSVLAKMGMSRRTEAAVYAARHMKTDNG